MAWKVTADVDRFDQAVEHFQQRVVLTDEQRKQLPVTARSRAFWVAGATQLETVQFVHDEAAKAIAQGLPFADFKKAVAEKLTKAWGREDSAAIETIFRNAAQTSYNAGRYHQLVEPSVLRFREFWMHDSVLDTRTTPECRSLDGLVIAADDPHWDTHWPPGHHKCRRSVRGLRRSEAERRGITTNPPNVKQPPGWGLSPKVATEWRPDTKGKDPALVAELNRKASEAPPASATPALPRLIDPPAKPDARESFPFGRGQIRLTPEQQHADQIARWLNENTAARQQANAEDRRTWFLWDWVVDSSRPTAVIAKRAAIREFALQGVAYPPLKLGLQGADLVRMKRDLRALYKETQAGFEKAGVKTVRLYRGLQGQVHRRTAIESWTADRRIADLYGKGPNGHVLAEDVPVEKILAHRDSKGWVDGPHGNQAEFLVMF